jgi:hypothetical protein
VYEQPRIYSFTFAAIVDAAQDGGMLQVPVEAGDALRREGRAHQPADPWAGGSQCLASALLTTAYRLA